MLWFGQPGPGEMVPRHERSVAPLSIDGRVFHQGEDVVMAYDAYNGLKLWERPIPGARRTGVSGNPSNFVVCHHGLLVAVGDRCLRLDPATGETLATYPLPPGPHAARWGYLACDGGLIYGSRTDNLPKGPLAAAPARLNFAGSVFAMDLQSGEVKWTYAGKSIGNNTISIGDGRLYLVDQDVTPQQREQVLAERRRQIADLPALERPAAERALKKADVRLVVALDAASGKVLWREPMDVTFGSRRRSGHDVFPRPAGGVQRLQRRPLLAAVLCGRVRRPAGGRALRRGWQAALDQGPGLSRPAADYRRYAARRAVGLRPPHGPTADAGQPDHRADGALAVCPSGPSLRLPQCLALRPVLPLVLPGVL